MFFLIFAGAAVDAEDNNSMTPAHLAVVGKHGEALKILLDSGADVNTKGGGME